jgi:transcriptional regulator with XRE-family HTH domain
MSTIRLGTNLKNILRQRKLSLKQISADTGIPYSTLHTWLENRQPKDVIKVKVLADYLDVSFSELLFGESETGGEKNQFLLPLSGNGNLEGVYEVIIRKRS